MYKLTNDEKWQRLIDLGVSEQTLQIVTSIIGYSRATFDNVLYAHTGLQSFDQLEDDTDD